MFEAESGVHSLLPPCFAVKTALDCMTTMTAVGWVMECSL